MNRDLGVLACESINVTPPTCHDVGSVTAVKTARWNANEANASPGGLQLTGHLRVNSFTVSASKL